MRKSLTLIAAALLSAGAAQAAPETYNIDSSHTFPRFSYNHMGLSTQLSKFNKTTGTVVFDKAEKTGSVDVVIDMKSVETGSSLFNQHIQGEDFLDTAKYPTASFKSTKVNFQGDKPSEIPGNLTIKGVTKPVILKVSHFVNTKHPMNGADAIGADASVVIKRSEFNAGKYAPAVGDEVAITITLEAVKQ